MPLLDAQPLGAVPLAGGLVEFRVWAPRARSVAVELQRRELPLAEAGEGIFAGRLQAAPGDDYRFVLDGGAALADPFSRSQPEGLRGPSRVVDTGAFAWSDAGWQGVSLDELVLYELHVGAFTEEGTFDAAIPHLERLRALGITAIELMPVATFPGDRGWGYDGVYTFAPHRAYGGPEGLVRLVDAAHAAGLGVFLDVVYNHLGPGAEELAAFGPWLSDRHTTPWGPAPDFRQDPVREWVLQNAELWVRDFHVDGLRLDAVNRVADDAPRHVLAELADRVRAASPHALVVSETHEGDFTPLDRWGHDAEWENSFHHALHALLTGERDGYYAPYGTVGDLARAYEQPRARRVVAYGQNHDQIGNRALGDRLTPAQDRLALAALAFAPHVPLLFMGEEYRETRPFQFFTDHLDPAVAEATRLGRRDEFRRFRGFDGELPDPQDERTLSRSKLSHDPPDPEVARLLALRRALPPGLETEVDEAARRLTVRRGPHTLRLDFAALTAEVS